MADRFSSRVGEGGEYEDGGEVDDETDQGDQVRSHPHRTPRHCIFPPSTSKLQFSLKERFLI